MIAAAARLVGGVTPSVRAETTPFLPRLARRVVMLQLIVVILQIPIRAMVVDTTLVRDIGVLAACLVLALMVAAVDRRTTLRGVTALDILVSLYLGYGVLTVPIGLVTDVPLFTLVWQFRNHFLPLVLYFLARRAFAEAKDHAKLISLFGIIAILLIASVIIEWALRINGVPAQAFPWNGFAALTSDRFEEGSSTPGGGYASLETIPILGIFGWPHYTVVPMMALFALSYPFLSSTKGVLPQGTLLARVPAVIRSQTTMGALAAVFILAVTMHKLTALVVLMLVPWLAGRRAVFRSARLVVVVAALLVAFPVITETLQDRLGYKIYGTAEVDSSLLLILSFEQVQHLFTQPGFQMLLGQLDVWAVTAQPIGWENRALFYTAVYGLTWLILFGAIFSVGVVYAMRLIRDPRATPQAKLYGVGCVGLSVVLGFDMAHYARLMTAPNIDIWAVAMGALSIQEVVRRQAHVGPPSSSIGDPVDAVRAPVRFNAANDTHYRWHRFLRPAARGDAQGRSNRGAWRPR